jgi:hypothetical protein
MTCIAWDGISLAADRGLWQGTYKARGRKVHRVQTNGRDILVATMGAAAYGEMVLDWLRGKVKEAPRAPTGDEEAACAVLIDERRRVWILNGRGIYVRIHQRRFADGEPCARAVAMGALAMGASARTAVRLAARYADGSALGVDSIRHPKAKR